MQPTCRCVLTNRPCTTAAIVLSAVFNAVRGGPARTQHAPLGIKLLHSRQGMCASGCRVSVTTHPLQLCGTGQSLLRALLVNLLGLDP